MSLWRLAQRNGTNAQALPQPRPGKGCSLKQLINNDSGQDTGQLHPPGKASLPNTSICFAAGWHALGTGRGGKVFAFYPKPR